MSENIRVEQEGGVAVLSLSRPAKKNALTVEMYADFAAALARLGEDRSVRVVRVRADGDTFCAGNDLMDFVQRPPAGDDSPVMRFLGQLLDFPKPIVASVRGAAVGIGTTMLLHFDLVYAAEDARFSLPFVKLGLVPEAASSLLLPRLAGYRLASELILLGEPFSAQTALRANIVNALAPASEVEGIAAAQAEKLAALPPESLQHSRALLRRADRADLEAAMRAEGEIFLQRLTSAEAAQAIMSFFSRK